MNNAKTPIVNFRTDSLTSDVRDMLSKGVFPVENKELWEKIKKDIGSEPVVAVMELPTADLELELWTKGGEPFDSATADDNKIDLGYLICLRYRDEDGKSIWETGGSLAAKCKVDFTSEHWRKALEEEMYTLLCKFLDEEISLL